MKKVLITGGSKGLGKCIKEKLENTYIIEDWSRSTGVDLTEKIPHLLDCDILILNAGTWENNFLLNYSVPKLLAEQVSKNIHVIFILSNAAYQNYGNDDYSTSKSGLLHYARRKQREGYKFSTISPGTINTEFWDNAEIDNRKKGCMQPEDVADLVMAIIKAGERGAVVTELIVLPEPK